MIIKIFLILFLGSVLTQANSLLTSKKQDAADKEPFTNKNVEAIKRLLIEKTNMEKNATSQKLIQDTARLGYWVRPYQNSSLTIDIGGYAFYELALQEQKIDTESLRIENQMKSLRKNWLSNRTTREKRSQPSPWSLNGTAVAFSIPETVLDSKTSQEFYITHGILQLKLDTLKKERADLLLEKKKLENKRNVLDSEMNRIYNEELSRFNSNPVLNGRYLLLTLLGKGGFAEVYKAYDLEEKRDVACKLHQLGTTAWRNHEATYINHTLREYNIHRVLDHPRIVKLYDAFEIDANTFCTVLEYCGGRSLENYLQQRGIIPENEAKLIVMQIVTALKYLNEIKPPVIHFDLKPDNILLMEESIPSEIKISDFGVSKILDVEDPDHGIYPTSNIVDLKHLPVDLFSSSSNLRPRLSSTVDTWSVGLLLYRCLFGTLPVMSETVEGVLKMKEVEFPETPTVSEEAKNFIRSCLRPKKEERINVLTMAKHPYLHPSLPDENWK